MPAPKKTAEKKPAKGAAKAKKRIVLLDAQAELLELAQAAQPLDALQALAVAEVERAQVATAAQPVHRDEVGRALEVERPQLAALAQHVQVAHRAMAQVERGQARQPREDLEVAQRPAPAERQRP